MKVDFYLTNHHLSIFFTSLLDGTRFSYQNKVLWIMILNWEDSVVILTTFTASGNLKLINLVQQQIPDGQQKLRTIRTQRAPCQLPGREYWWQCRTRSNYPNLYTKKESKWGEKGDEVHYRGCSHYSLSFWTDQNVEMDTPCYKSVEMRSDTIPNDSNTHKFRPPTQITCTNLSIPPRSRTLNL